MPLKQGMLYIMTHHCIKLDEEAEILRMNRGYDYITKSDITLSYRTGVSPVKDPTRFAASEALMRACAFTLIRPKDDGKHKADSAAKAIQSTLIMSKEQIGVKMYVQNLQIAY